MTNPIDMDVFHGPLSPHAARVYVALEASPDLEDAVIRGHVRGPICRYAKTLPTTHRLESLEQTGSPMLSAVIPDPCFWSPELPALYTVEVEFRRHDQVVTHTTREFGLRWLAVRGNSFYLEGRRWVLRGIHANLIDLTPAVETWRDVGAAMLVDDPSDELCEETSRTGVMLVVRSGGRDWLELRRLLRWASVAFVIGSSGDSSMVPRVVRSNLIWLHDDQGTKGETQQSAQLMDVHKMPFEEVGRAAQQKAVVAIRELAETRDIHSAREACDHLQRDLAPFGDCAGYLV